jgi:hypothetical protein
MKLNVLCEVVRTWYVLVRVLISLWLSKGILFLQDCAAPHKVAIMHQKLADLHFEVLKRPAYLPDLAPSDYCLFPNLFIQPKNYKPPPPLHILVLIV